MKRILLIFFTLFLITCKVHCAEPPQRAVELYNQGIDYYQAGEIQKSINSFNEAIRIAPDFYEAYYNLGQIQVAENKLDEAIKTYTAIQNLRPGDNENLYSLGKTLFKRGYLAKSLTYYKQIQPTSKYYTEAQKDIAKITRRQKELQAEADAKAATAKLAAAQKSIEQKFADQNQIAGAEKPFDKKDMVIGTVVSKPNDILDSPKQTERTESYLQTQKDTLLNSRPTIEPVKQYGATILPVNSSKSTVYEGISSPSGVAMDSNGNTYIASYSDNLIYKINPQNQKSVFVSSNVLNGPIGLAVDDSGNLYVANYNKGNILKVAPNGSPAVFLTIKNPYCLNITNNVLFITEQATNTIVKYTL